jgi:hypothetical protein
MIEHICTNLTEKRIALFSDNNPTVSWVQRMECRSSLIAKQLIRVLTLRMNAQRCCPLTTLHITGDQSSMTDIPSRSFGSEAKWHFKTEAALLTFFNKTFPIPNQNSWNVCQPTSAIVTRVTSILRTVPFRLDNWRQLPAVGKNIGTSGSPVRGLWEWTLIFRMSTLLRECASSPASSHGYALATTVKENKSKNAQSQARLRPLGRRLYWPATTTPQK